MNVFVKRFSLGACFIVMMSATIVPESPLRLGFFRDAEAIVVRRAVAPVATVAVVSTVAASSANKNAAAAANANAAAANANAAAAASKPPPAATPAGPLPVGTIVTTLPPGCAPTVLNGVEYERCGTTYYRATMMGSNLVFVVQQP
jgi:hypothetical protein